MYRWMALASGSAALLPLFDQVKLYIGFLVLVCLYSSLCVQFVYVCTCIYTRLHESIVRQYEHVVSGTEGNQWGRDVQRQTLQHITRHSLLHLLHVTRHSLRLHRARSQSAKVTFDAFDWSADTRFIILPHLSLSFLLTVSSCLCSYIRCVKSACHTFSCKPVNIHTYPVVCYF